MDTVVRIVPGSRMLLVHGLSNIDQRPPVIKGQMNRRGNDRKAGADSGGPWGVNRAAVASAPVMTDAGAWGRLTPTSGLPIVPFVDGHYVAFGGQLDAARGNGR